MNFCDIGIIISLKPLKENLDIMVIFTKDHGLYSAIVRRALRKNYIINQTGNLVDFFWKARLREHIGVAKCELIKSYCGFFINDKIKLFAFNSIIDLVKFAFHDGAPNNDFFVIFKKYLDSLTKNFSIIDYFKFELDILTHSGYGLALDVCAVTGSKNDLCYVSPKSGRAISSSAGLEFADKLLLLPKFLYEAQSEITFKDKKQAFLLTSYFFNRYFFHNCTQPESRKVFFEHIIMQESAIISN
jgi:DNA repair protein RecO (recombination protein O)